MILQSKVYAVMEYHDQPLQFINRYYFHAKTKGDEHYDLVYNIITLLGFLPFALWIVFMVLCDIYIYPKINSFLESLPPFKKEDILKYELPKIEEIPLLCLSIFLNGSLLAFHILSAVDLLEYGNDVLQSDQDLNVVTITLSLFVVVVTYILALGRSVYRCFEAKKASNNEAPESGEVNSKAPKFRRLAAMSITVNAVHLVCYFLPYMLLSFIYNPLQTCFTYLGLGLLIMCVYLLFWIYTRCCTLFCTKLSDSSTNESSTNDSSTHDSPTNDSSTNDSSTNDSPTGDSPTGDSPTGDSPTGDSPTGDSPTGDPPTGDSPTGDPPTGDSPTGDSPTGNSHTGDSSTGDSSTGDFLGFSKIFAPGENNRYQCSLIIACVFLSLGILLIAIYFSAVIIYVLFLGSLNDFEVIQNLVPPLLIAVLTYLVVKPTYKQAKQIIKPDANEEGTENHVASNGTDQHTYHN